jgi:hypothetical protein
LTDETLECIVGTNRGDAVLAVKNTVILNDSTALEGNVITETFTLKSAYGPIKLDRSQISNIEYRSAYYAGKDMVLTSDRTTLVGELLPDVISIEISGQTLQIPKADIHFIVLFVGPIGNVSSKTKKLLAKAGN